MSMIETLSRQAEIMAEVDTLESAVLFLDMNKGDLMKIVFGREYSGIDSAIPLDYSKAQRAAGKEFNWYWYVTDCRSSIYEVVDLREAISIEKAEALIQKAQYIKLYYAGFVCADEARSEVQALDAIIDPVGDKIRRGVA